MPFSAAEGEKKKNTHKKKKNVGKSIGDPVRGRDAPISGYLLESWIQNITAPRTG